MLALRLGWRNLWRNPRRSLITLSTVAVALIFLILILGMTEGLKEQLLENGTRLMLGHLQIHHRDYLPDRNLYDTLGGDQGIDLDLPRQLEQTLGLQVATPRVYGFALLSSGESSAGAQLMGIVPQSERRLSTFLETVPPASGVGPQAAGRIVLGEGLAQELQVTAGSEIAAMTQAADGSLGNALFRVGAILRTGLVHFDRSLAILHLEDLQELLALRPDQVHEIAGRLSSPMEADAATQKFNRQTDPIHRLEASSWGDLAPTLRDYLQLFEGTYGVLIGLVAIFCALGILNTMAMAVFERSREIGTVASLGMSPVQILASVILESVCLTAMGLVLGLAIGWLLMQPLVENGLDLSRWTGELAMLDTHMDPVLRFKWFWPNALNSALVLILSAVLAAALPAFRAARMNPVDALNSAGGG